MGKQRNEKVYLKLKLGISESRQLSFSLPM
jgi:hypothetical protein